MFATYSRSDRLTLQVTGSDLVRCVGYDLLGMQDALLNQAPDHVIVYAKQLGSFRHRQPLAILFGGTIGMYTMLASHRTYALRIPGHTLPSTHTHTIE